MPGGTIRPAMRLRCVPKHSCDTGARRQRPQPSPARAPAPARPPAPHGKLIAAAMGGSERAVRSWPSSRATPPTPSRSAWARRAQTRSAAPLPYMRTYVCMPHQPQRTPRRCARGFGRRGGDRCGVPTRGGPQWGHARSVTADALHARAGVSVRPTSMHARACACACACVRACKRT
jgi:hypothetical protein